MFDFKNMGIVAGEIPDAPTLAFLIRPWEITLQCHTDSQIDFESLH